MPMKKLYVFIYTICFFCLTACQDDFDEMNDSPIRHVTFTLDVSNLFDSILVMQSEKQFVYGIPAVLDADNRLRVTAFCYDRRDSLLQRQMTLVNELSTTSITFRHINKDVDYRFVFIADIVKYDPNVEYYETWYQMDARSWNRFYFFSDSRSEHPQQDVMYSAQIMVKPSNQTVDVMLSPLTYNGYCVFVNTEKVDRLTGFASYVNSFRLSTKSWLRRASLAYEYSYYRPKEASIIFPMNLTYADSIIYVKAKNTTLFGTDSVIVNIPNKNRRPFVVTIDCETTQLKECKFY